MEDPVFIIDNREYRSLQHILDTHTFTPIPVVSLIGQADSQVCFDVILPLSPSPSLFSLSYFSLTFSIFISPGSVKSTLTEKLMNLVDV